MQNRRILSGKSEYGKRIILFSDLDGTITSEDMLDIICDLKGKKERSRSLNVEYIKGMSLSAEIQTKRINLLRGLSVSAIHRKIEENSYLLPGARDLFEYLGRNEIISVLVSGNILPILEYYKKMLKIDYVYGINPIVDNEIIKGVHQKDIPHDDFKLQCFSRVVRTFPQRPFSVVMGDSPSDIGLFKAADYRIAVNSKGGIDRYADITIQNSLSSLPSILDKLLKDR